jgi:hypothetical protein
MSEESSKLYSKTETIEILQQTIQRLQTILETIETESEEVLPAIASVNSLVTTTEELANSLDQMIPRSVVAETQPEVPKISEIPEIPEIPETITENLKIPELEVTEDNPQGLDSILPSFNKVETWWDKVLNSIRSFLPQPWQNKLSDLALTGIISTIVVILLSTSVLLIPQPTNELDNTDDLGEISDIIKVIPDNIPPQLISPQEPKPLEDAPLPEPSFTPEQGLIAAIRNQIDSFTDQYTEGLIVSIEPNFIGSNLTVKVSDQWYVLTENNQQKLANQMLEQANFLDFKKLAIIDREGKLVARSPVVGSKMVLLENS